MSLILLKFMRSTNGEESNKEFKTILTQTKKLKKNLPQPNNLTLMVQVGWSVLFEKNTQSSYSQTCIFLNSLHLCTENFKLDSKDIPEFLISSCFCFSHNAFFEASPTLKKPNKKHGID